MAVASQNLAYFVNGVPTQKASKLLELMFLSLSVTSDGGTTVLTLSESAGAWDMGAANVTNVGTVDGRNVSVDGGHIDNLVTLSGVASGSVDLGTFTGTTIPDASTEKAALQSLETALELKAADSVVIKKDGSVAFTGSQSMGGNSLTSVADPVAAQDAATKAYVDANSQGLDLKASVRLATDVALAANTYANGTSGVGATLTANANGALGNIDGVAPALNDRILVKNEAGLDNGIYEVTALGDASNPWIMTRVTDADSASEITAGLFTFVEEGTTNGDVGFVLTTNDPITVGTTALSFTQFSSAGQVSAGNGLSKTGSTLDVNVDSSTIEIVTDTLQVKDAGIALAKLAVDSVDENKIKSTSLGDGLAGGSGTALSVDYTKSLTNAQGSTITVRQVVKIGATMTLATATDSGLSDVAFGVVSDASIANTAAGLIYVRRGAVISGFSGLTPGKAQYVDATTAGSLTEIAPSTTGQAIVKIGRAISATEIEFDPQFVSQIA